MIIECIKCDKKFDVDSNLIPSEGRSIQCGSCNHVWFFKKNHIEPSIQLRQNYQENKDIELSKQNLKKKQNKPAKNTTEFIKKKVSTNLNSQDKSNFTFFKFLSYILVIIISFIALVIILDTFKSPLYSLFPKLEFLLFSLFETLKDINLFIKDLI